MEKIGRFTKKERSGFKYWFAHWCAFQMVALNLKIWKPKYLLHDFEKPWLKLFWSYNKVQKFHRKHNRHHFGYQGTKGYDYEAMIIDWECSRFTKVAMPHNARGEAMYLIKSKPNVKDIIEKNILPLLDKLGL